MGRSRELPDTHGSVLRECRVIHALGVVWPGDSVYWDLKRAPGAWPSRVADCVRTVPAVDWLIAVR